MKKAGMIAAGILVAMAISGVAMAGGSSDFPPEKPFSIWSWLFGGSSPEWPPKG
jgi:hypothetical protein